jgi:uncharacterized Tic20 family protein
MASAQSGPIDAISLRGGGSLDVWPDRVEANGHVYAIADLSGAVRMTDPAAATRGAAQPALGLRGRDGAWTVYVPADPPDVERALRAIYLLRPDLQGATGSAPPRYVPPRTYVGPDGVTREQALLACIAHLSIFFAPFIVPLIIWLALQPTAPYAAYQAKQALVFHFATAALAFVVVFVLIVAFFGSLLGSAATGDTRVAIPALFAVPLLIILIVACAVFVLGFSIYAAVQTFQGRPFHYPLLGWL